MVCGKIEQSNQNHLKITFYQVKKLNKSYQIKEFSKTHNKFPLIVLLTLFL